MQSGPSVQGRRRGRSRADIERRRGEVAVPLPCFALRGEGVTTAVAHGLMVGTVARGRTPVQANRHDGAALRGLMPDIFWLAGSPAPRLSCLRMVRATRSLAIGLMLVSLVAAGVAPCLCSSMHGAAGHGHCAGATEEVRAAEPDCGCACMKSSEPSLATGAISVLASAAPPLAVQLAPLFVPGPHLSRVAHAPARLHPSPPPSPPTVLRI